VPYRSARFGWIPDLPDQRDYLYAAPPQTLAALPSSADLRPQCPPIYDQGQVGSCTANAIAAAHQFAQMKEGLPAPSPFAPSRFFIYYNERAIEGTVSSDSGAQIRDGMKSIAQQGVCPESEWPYNPAAFPNNPQLLEKPSQQAYTDAANYEAIQYQSLTPVLTQLKGCLASGYPFVFGFTVYESFESPAVASSGQVPMPKHSEQTIGGHAVVAVGYDDTTQHFIVRNSWGTGWGIGGYCMMPYLYLTNAHLASDFWTLQQVK
jgi:C1A family cysteine protease